MLASGTRLGPYEILAPLGAGGMGEVYRARDTRLGRDVAIKTLPAAFARDPERRSRFETEARAVAALSHPNVLAIHDFGTEGEITYAVMELVEGHTLREKLMDGPIAGPRAMSLAIQIARGLSAAHDKGVIHRDLKPENVILTPEGHAKILDFGLAKREPEAEAESHSTATTLAVATEPGSVLGTTGYMAPEQVRGLPANARSDIFALGVVIYEMLSGRRPFRGDSPADTMSAILREDPAELSQLVPDVSPAIERIVRRCLEKQPTGRFRSAADLAYALEAISSGSGTASSGSGALAALTPSRPRFKRLSYRNGLVAAARFVPNGGGILYGASWEGNPCEIFSAHPGSPEARSLGLPHANLLSISATGEMAVSLGYRHHFWNQVTGTLARTSLGGGGVRPVQKDIGHADWGPDGRAMAVVRYVEGSCRLEYPSGNLRFETPDWISRPAVSPDGGRVAFAHHPRTGDSSGALRVCDANGILKTLSPDMTSISGITWSPAGDEVWCSGINAEQQNGIWGFRLDGAQREVYSSPARVSLHDVARDGRVLMSLGNMRLGLSVSPGDGAREVDLSWFDGPVATDLSADGSLVLFSEGHEAENPYSAGFLRNVDGSPAVRLGDGISTRISPDGQWVLGVLSRPDPELFMYPTGLGEPRRVQVDGVERILWAGFHPDGRQLFVVGSTGGQAMRPFLVPMAGGEARLLWEEAIKTNRFNGLPVSPDGDRLVLRRVTGEQVMFSCGTGAVEPLPILGAEETAIRFDSTGRFLYVSGPETESREVYRVDLETGERVLWRRLEPPDRTGVFYVGDPVISPDGACLAYSFYRHISDLYLVEGLV